MKEDNTFLLSKSTGLIIDWEHPLFEICQDGFHKRRDKMRGTLCQIRKDNRGDSKQTGEGTFQGCRDKDPSISWN